MADRVRITSSDVEDRGNYFADQSSPLEFITSGCAVLDCVLGGGWPLSRIANVVGDSSTGKTLIAIEALANFKRKYPKGRMYYRESEAAFDMEYAAALGMPVDDVEFIEPEKFTTVEDFYEDLRKCVTRCEDSGQPAFYVVDSLDALTSEDEQGKEFNEASYETKKAKQMGKLFRMCTADVGRVNMALMIISQTRDKIGISFGGPQKTRSGGRALDFYASQVLWLSHRDKVDETRNKVKRVIGIQVRARMMKSKIALPYRECDFTIRFGQGIDSLSSSLDWLKSVGYLEEVIVDTSMKAYGNRLKDMSDEDYWEEVKRVDKEIVRIWREIERSFLQGSRQKYRD
jgi:recombination protein RecA